jgi:hypothetical protein
LQTRTALGFDALPGIGKRFPGRLPSGASRTPHDARAKAAEPILTARAIRYPAAGGWAALNDSEDAKGDNLRRLGQRTCP